MTSRKIGSNQTEIETTTARVLISYTTPVAAYVYDRGYIRTSEFYSATTTKHINKYVCEDCELVDQSVLDQLIT